MKRKGLYNGLWTLAFFLILASPVFAEEAAAAVPAAPPLDTGNNAWMLVSSALVLLMMPGLAMFYGGLVRTKNVLGTMMHSFGAMALIGVLWVVCGYSMAFGKDVAGGWFGWQPDLFFLKSIDDLVDGGLPKYSFAMFQGMFAIITPALIAGAFAERVSFRGYMFFIGLWCLLVYCPLCHWVWAADGYLFKKSAIDFAGGTVVHISSGVSGLVLALILGTRSGYPKVPISPNNMTMTLLGSALLWVGWFGFNAGSAVASNLSAAQAFAATQTAAAAGALTWVILEGVVYGKSTCLGLASGILAGLVVITPAAGVATPMGAIVLAIIATFVCYYGIKLKSKFGYDDSLDAFGVHGLAGMTGAIGLTFFVRGGVYPAGGFGQQLGVQLTSVVITIVFAAIMTLIIGLVVDKTVGLRLAESKEIEGMDQSLHGEHGYDIVN